MVVPLALGGPSILDENALQVPGVVQSKHSPFWWTLFAICVATGVVSFVATDWVGGLLMLLLGTIVFCMVRNRCERMNQCMLLWLGMLFLIEFLFNFINLCTILSGRTSMSYSRQTLPMEAGTSSSVVTITSTHHPLFDQSLGWRYNLQSAMFIVDVVVTALGALLCYVTYNAFETGLLSDAWDDDADVGRAEAGYGPGRPGGYGGADGPGGGHGGGQVYRQGRPNNGNPGPRQSPLFGGQGNRLGG
mmetsp:Transcript_47870/g.113767  ORF Transcript_47870/g.113767 Transcript_47870/m.113767 type:complete len:247 (+) Transcript_47870:124-864(+)